MRHAVWHNWCVEFLGGCDCGCHSRPPGWDGCWCRGTAEVPHRINHNDAVRHFGGCPSPHHRAQGEPVTCQVHTDPVWRRMFDEKARRDQEDRVRRGHIRNSSDLNLAIRKGWIGRPR